MCALSWRARKSTRQRLYSRDHVITTANQDLTALASYHVEGMRYSFSIYVHKQVVFFFSCNPILSWMAAVTASCCYYRGSLGVHLCINIVDWSFLLYKKRLQTNAHDETMRSENKDAININVFSFWVRLGIALKIKFITQYLQYTHEILKKMLNKCRAQKLYKLSQWLIKSSSS